MTCSKSPRAGNNNSCEEVEPIFFVYLFHIVMSVQDNTKDCKENANEPASKRARIEISEEIKFDVTKTVDGITSSLLDEPFQQRRLNAEDYVIGGEYFIHNTSIPTKHNYNLRWQERLGSSCIPASSFCYELTFSAEIEDTFFMTQWQHLPYCAAHFDRYLLYPVVKNVTAPINSIVTEGDIVLRVNNTGVVLKPGDIDNTSELIQSITQRNSHRTIRFLRASSYTHSSLSVAEVLLHLEERNVAAKFLCKYMNRSAASAKPVLESTYVDVQLPAAIRKVLQGQRVYWQNAPNLPSMPSYATGLLASTTSTTPAAFSSAQTGYSSQPALQLPNGLSIVTPLIQVHTIEKYDNKQHRNVTSYTIRSGIYRDRNRYTVLYAAASIAGAWEGTGKEKVLYNLGRFDTEEEAARVLNDAKESAKGSGGVFVPRHFLLGYKHTSAPVPSLSSGYAHVRGAGGYMAMGPEQQVPYIAQI
jgi:hypothetical protein